MPAHHTSKGIMLSCLPWGRGEGKDIVLFRLQHESGSYVELTNYGATLVSGVVPDKQGNHEHVVLGFPSLMGYRKDECYIGRTVGRFANRIGNASFALDGMKFMLEKNDGDHNNHGGFHGFHARVFDFDVQNDRVSFRLSAKDGEGGFPGNVQLTVDYAWSDNNTLEIHYKAVTDKPTVLNITNHAYFNLSGSFWDIFEHRLSIRSRQYLETTAQHIPTGVILSTKERPFQNTRIRERVSSMDENIRGLNRYYIFDKRKDYSEPACVLTEPVSGRTLEIFTTYPGVQLYTGDHLSSRSGNHHSDSYGPFEGLCLECQHYPDSPNHAHFPSTVLNPGAVYDEKIVYRFGVNHST